ncbi:hypothetical protein J437_LFUL000421 [Ladona fulva]|uniref:Mut7-C RNAse domain-containing protein n=1 Tax=Ladona fulva TaxID=123851 RepID=A0A8K0K498_LADFU|nr:hypothetical protein J437_LFUL000421 [Ladona fulva]
MTLFSALDAYCLLEIYQFFKDSCLNQGIAFNEVVNATLRGSKPCHAKPSKKQRKRNNQSYIAKSLKCVESQEQQKSDYPPSLPQSFKMVCDAMIQGLGRKLRSCGINTWILQNCDDADVCLKIALRDKRIILTRGSNYHKICNGDMFVEVHNSLMRKIVGRFSDIPTLSFGDMHLEDHTDGARGFSADLGKKWVKNNHLRELKEVTDKTFKGVKIKFERIPVPLLSKIEYFYICEKCGKVYWDGGHWQRELCKKREANLLK